MAGFDPVVTGTPVRLIRVTLGNLSNIALLALFDEHWEALAQVLAESPSYVELGSEWRRDPPPPRLKVFFPTPKPPPNVTEPILPMRGGLGSST